MDESWQEIAARQAGVLNRRQALQAGLTSKAWDWRLTHGWQSPVRGVAVTHTGPLTDLQLLWSAALYAGTSALLTGDAALLAWGMKGVKPRRLDVAVPWARQVAGASISGVTATDLTRRLPGGEQIRDAPRIEVHRVLALDRLAPNAGWSPPRLDAAAAALHAAAFARSDREAEWRLAAVVQQRITAVPLLREQLALLPKLPRRALVAQVLDDVQLGAHAASELQFLRFCRAHDLPLPDALQVRVRVGATRYLDARYERQRVTVEVDGRHHQQVEHWDADALRTLEVAVALPGERVIRLTPGLMRHQAEPVAALLRALLL